ncbi:MAG: AAA family ATPase [Nannocystaceae bacterium]
MRIEKLTVRNYRVFSDACITDPGGFAVFIGANGTGKSTLFDVFAFLRDALQDNVHVALTKRGGFREVVSRGRSGPISFEVKFRDLTHGGEKAPLATYQLDISEQAGRGVVEREVLKYRRGQHGRPWHFLDFRRGEGQAVTNEAEYGQTGVQAQREQQRLDSPDILAIKGLGQFQRFRVVSAFRRLIERWHLSDFHIRAARSSQEHGYAEHLSPQGDNLPLVTQFLFENHPDKFNNVLKRMAARVPGISDVEATETVDGRLVLRFRDGVFRDPFIARHVSDGTIKMFAYLMLLSDPSPHPLLCVEEPENQLYPELLHELAEEFREYGAKGQVMVSTHSPDFISGLRPEEVFWLTKRDGFTEIRRVQDDKQILALLEEGDNLGALWRQGLFEGAHP